MTPIGNQRTAWRATSKQLNGFIDSGFVQVEIVIIIKITLPIKNNNLLDNKTVFPDDTEINDY